MPQRQMNKKEEQELEEFEKKLSDNNYLPIILVSTLLVCAGISCAWMVFSMISHAINSYFGG